MSLLLQEVAHSLHNLFSDGLFAPISESHITYSSKAHLALPRRPHLPRSHQSFRRGPPVRLIVCSDGPESEHASNIERLSIAINKYDTRKVFVDGGRSPVQITYSQSGKKDKLPEFVRVSTGEPSADRVVEAYTFIADNYLPGDEIFLFGFSSGAYVARMVAKLIGEIGILNDDDLFEVEQIFTAYQRFEKSNNEEREKLKATLDPWTCYDSPGKERIRLGNKPFWIQCLGLFETIGSMGFPDEYTMCSNETRKLYGFSDRTLGEHVQRAYQALALDETRPGFNCNKLEQTEGGKRKGQVLKQCWFSGNHFDVGGGYAEHDLADLTLLWIAANIEEILSLNVDYLLREVQPVAPWGKQKPHDSHKSGIFTSSFQRQFSTQINKITNETIHSSVLQQPYLYPELVNAVEMHPDLVEPLLPLEVVFRLCWPFGKPGLQIMSRSVMDPLTKE
ncbi:hypothetical protein BDQ17DRAFT_1272768 [Cyathus striatus]|nr:hypothetical protein BDQ17DRAFT_1272768 [Cyathus striatus]